MLPGGHGSWFFPTISLITVGWCEERVVLVTVYAPFLQGITVDTGDLRHELSLLGGSMMLLIWNTGNYIGILISSCALYLDIFTASCRHDIDRCCNGVHSKVGDAVAKMRRHDFGSDRDTDR